MRNLKSVYLMKTKEGLVKIGVSNDSIRRRDQVEKTYNVEIDGILISPLCNFALKVERIMHDYYSDKWVKNEFFDIDYSDAKLKLNNLMYYFSFLKGSIVKDFKYKESRMLTSRNVSGSFFEALMIMEISNKKQGSYMRKRYGRDCNQIK